jgi:transposase
MSKFSTFMDKKSPSKTLDSLFIINRKEIKKGVKFEFSKSKPRFAPIKPKQTEFIVGQLYGHDSVLDALRPSDSNRRYFQKQQSRASVAATARMLGCSRWTINKMVKTFADGGVDAVGKIEWGSGRPMKFHGLTQEEMNTAVAKQTTNSQAGMSMTARAAQLTIKTGKTISPEQLRRLYHGRSVSTQLPVKRLWKPKLPPPEVQRKEIYLANLRYLNLFYSEYEVISCDSAIFSPRGYRHATWAPQNDPVNW